MATFPEQFYLKESTRWQRFTRDLRLIQFMISMLWRWATAGRRIRKAYRQAQATGETLWLDDLDPYKRRAPR